ncbi:MAG: serine/threonine-protein phosphatase, partial [Clostridia bacterium]|nr:serine/threonine-protein phosphatase [Clostridia bacterium]
TVIGGKADYLRSKSGLVLGGMEGVRYKEHSVSLGKGDIVCLYTDGITEAVNGNMELFGEERLLACFENAQGVSAGQIIDTVRNSVDSFVAGNSQFDDMTMLCFRFI